jgi:hypothetical protein
VAERSGRTPFGVRSVEPAAMKIMLFALAATIILFVFKGELERWAWNNGMGAVSNMLQGPYLLVILILLALMTAISLIAGRS